MRRIDRIVQTLATGGLAVVIVGLLGVVPAAAQSEQPQTLAQQPQERAPAVTSQADQSARAPVAQGPGWQRRQQVLREARRMMMQRGWQPPLGPAMRQQMRQQLRQGMATRRLMQQRMGRPMMARPNLQQQLFRGIRLDEAQRAKVRDINERNRAQLQDLNTRLRDSRRALNQARTAETIDEGAIRKSASEVAAAEADLAIARGRLRTELLGLLTPEQQKTLKDRRQAAADRAERLRERRQAPATPAPPKK
jgi:Spy/CpxP family protein refolding chaperone